MKKNLLKSTAAFFATILFCAFCLSFNVNAQDPGDPNYQTLKANGQLPQPPQSTYHGPYTPIPGTSHGPGLLVPLNTAEYTAFPRNDDSFLGPIGLPFVFCFYGIEYSECYINNNGNISFGDGFSRYTSTGFPVDDFPMIAAFWADIDTRGAGSGLCWYKIESNRLIVTWESVGYFAANDDLLSTFQLIITDGTDPVVGINNNVAFSYDDMQWTTGDLSGGVGGFGGTPATVGVNKGDGVTFVQVGRFDHEGVDWDGADGNNDGVSYLDGRLYKFNACGEDIVIGNDQIPVSNWSVILVIGLIAVSTIFIIRRRFI